IVFGVPRMSWRYTSILDTRRVLVAVSTTTAVLVVLRFSLPLVGDHTGLVVIPFGILAMDFVLVFLGLAGVRASRRLQGEAQERRHRAAGIERHRVLLIGAGEAGVLVAREISHRPDLGLQLVGFIDDDPLKARSQIGGLPVLGTTSHISQIAE